MKIKETKICNKKKKKKRSKTKKEGGKNIGCSRGRVMTFDMYISIYAFLFIVVAAYFFKICFVIWRRI